MCGDNAGPLFAAMREAGREAAEPVAAAVREAYPQRSGDLAGSVRVTATRTGAGVRVGTAKVRYAGSVDFGGYPPKKSTVYPYIGTGRYLYPTAQNMDLASKAGQTYTEAAQKALDGFDWTNATSNPEAVHD
jgi:hypothetical protein